MEQMTSVHEAELTSHLVVAHETSPKPIGAIASDRGSLSDGEDGGV